MAAPRRRVGGPAVTRAAPLLLVLTALRIVVITPRAPAFQLQPQHSTPRPWGIGQPGRPCTRVAFGASEPGSEGAGKGAAADAASAASGPASSGGLKPRPFLSKRMRRGALGPTPSSSSSSGGGSSSQPKEEDSKDDAATPAPTASSPKKAASATGGPEVLKLSKKWACVAGCGACCYLAPEERPFLLDYFEDPEDLARYNSMVGDDGWCVHYDKAARACTVFADRPWFCRVEAATFGQMYGVEPQEMDRFCTACCREQIADVYGVGSGEMKQFNLAIKTLKEADSSGGAGAGTAAGRGGGAGKGFGSKAAAAASAGPVVPVDPFTREPTAEEKVKADWV